LQDKFFLFLSFEITSSNRLWPYNHWRRNHQSVAPIWLNHKNWSYLFSDNELDEDKDIWWFSVIDIVRVLTQQDDYQTTRKYWNELKQRLAGGGWPARKPGTNWLITGATTK